MYTLWVVHSRSECATARWKKTTRFTRCTLFWRLMFSLSRSLQIELRRPTTTNGGEVSFVCWLAQFGSYHNTVQSQFVAFGRISLQSISSKPSAISQRYSFVHSFKVLLDVVAVKQKRNEAVTPSTTPSSSQRRWNRNRNSEYLSERETEPRGGVARKRNSYRVVNFSREQSRRRWTVKYNIQS